MLLVLISCSPDNTGVAVEEEFQMHDFDKLWNYNEPGETEQKFREILANTNEQEDPGYELELRTQIARTLNLQQTF